MNSEQRRGQAFAEVWSHICDIAKHDGVAPLNQHPGVWIFDVGAWRLALNAHGEPMEYDGHKVDPYHCYVEFNGWPAGIITPRAGTVAFGKLANIFTLRDALKARAEARRG